MSKEYSEALGKNIRYKKEYIGNDTYRLYIKKNEIELLENYLEQEQIKNAKPSKALDSLEEIVSYYNEPQYELGGGYSYKNELLESCGDEVNTVKQALIKAQKDEKIVLGIEDYLNRRIEIEPIEDVRKAFIEIRNQLQVMKEVIK